MASTPVKEFAKQARPLLSRSREEAKKRVIKLYRDWYRAIQRMKIEYELPLSHEEAAQKIRSEFMKYKDVTDVRVIDMLVLKSYNELDEIRSRFKFICQFYYKYKLKPSKTQDFLSKFLSGTD